MPFDPNLPANGAEIISAELRGQFSGLKELMDAIPSVTSAQVDGVTTLEPGQAATVAASIVDGVLHFQFGIPAGPAGPTGEVTNTVLSEAIATTSHSSNSVGLLNLTVADPPERAQMQSLTDKLDELINALRRM
jgi:hypothetical protein